MLGEAAALVDWLLQQFLLLIKPLWYSMFQFGKFKFFSSFNIC